MFRHTGPRALHRGDGTTAADTKENNDEGNEGNGGNGDAKSEASNDSNDSDDSDSSPEDAWRVIATLDCGDVSGRLDARVLRPADPAARRGRHRRRQAVRPGEAER